MVSQALETTRSANANRFPPFTSQIAPQALETIHSVDASHFPLSTSLIASQALETMHSCVHSTFLDSDSGQRNIHRKLRIQFLQITCFCQNPEVYHPAASRTFFKLRIARIRAHSRSCHDNWTLCILCVQIPCLHQDSASCDKHRRFCVLRLHRIHLDSDSKQRDKHRRSGICRLRTLYPH